MFDRADAQAYIPRYTFARQNVPRSNIWLKLELTYPNDVANHLKSEDGTWITLRRNMVAIYNSKMFTRALLSLLHYSKLIITSPILEHNYPGIFTLRDCIFKSQKYLFSL